MTLHVRTDRTLVRAHARSTRYLHVSFTAPEAAARDGRRPLTVAFVLDRSGSMEGQKIELARQAVDAAVRLLKPDDLFSVVVYDNQVDVLLPAQRATAGARALAAERLATIAARGSTDLCTGWLRGCEQVAGEAALETVARCLLLSDGHANVGVTDRDVLAARAGQLRSRFVVTSTLGLGADFDERLMASMAHAGGGNFYYVEHARQIPDVLTSELGEALEVVARRAQIDFELPDGVEADVLHEFSAERIGNRRRVALDDLVSGQQVSFVLKLRFPQGAVSDELNVRAVLGSADGRLGASAAISWTYADSHANDVQPRDRAVDREVARIYAARARREAVELNRAGRFEDAAALLRATRRRILAYADGDSELLQIANSLHMDEPDYSVPMSAMLMKRAHYGSLTAMKSRRPDGRALRRGGA